jgi:hypothetical protein
MQAEIAFDKTPAILAGQLRPVILDWREELGVGGLHVHGRWLVNSIEDVHTPIRLIPRPFLGALFALGAQVSNRLVVRLLLEAHGMLQGVMAFYVQLLVALKVASLR